MSNLQKPFTKRQLEKRVQEVEADYQKICRELDRISDAGAGRILERIIKVTKELNLNPVQFPMEQQRSDEELHDLYNNALYLEYMDTVDRVHAAEDRVYAAKRDLEHLITTLDIAETPPVVASLPEMSLPKAGDAVPLKSKSSQSLFCLC